MGALLDSLNTGGIFALLAISFYMCLTKLKFINLIQGISFYISGFFTVLLYNFSYPLWFAILIPMILNIALGICNVIFIRLGIDKTLSSILLLGVFSIFLPSVFPGIEHHFDPQLLKKLYITPGKLFIALIFLVSFFFATYHILLKSKNSFQNFTITLCLANFLSGVAGLLYFIQKQSMPKDYISPIIISCVVFFISRLFLGSVKNITIQFILIFTSSILLSQITKIFELYDIAKYININYVYIIISFICALYLKFKIGSFSMFDNLLTTNTDVNVNSHKFRKSSMPISNELLETIKTQYI